MNKKEYIASKIEYFLQNNCSDEWHIKIEGTKIIAFYTTKKRFEIVYNNDFEDWYISGKELHIGMIGEISAIIKHYEERGF